MNASVDRRNVRQHLEQVAVESDLAARHYALLNARIEAILHVPVPRPGWVKTAIGQLREATSSCASEVARLLNTTHRRARYILEDYVAALEDAEQEHNPSGFARWLVDEAALTGYLRWVDNTDEEDYLEENEAAEEHASQISK